MVDLEIVFMDRYSAPVPGYSINGDYMDVVYKNNTLYPIVVFQDHPCGSIASNSVICIPPFATSGYYLWRWGPVFNCPVTSLNVYRCVGGEVCSPTASCAVRDANAMISTGLPTVRNVANLPTEASIIEYVTTNIPSTTGTTGTGCNTIAIHIAEGEVFKKGSSIKKVTGGIFNCDGFQGTGHQIFPLPIRVTVDIGTYRALDKTVNSFYNRSCFLFWCEEIQPNWDAGLFTIPETININGIDTDTTGMPITITASFAGDSVYTYSSKTVVARVSRGPVIEAIGATPVSVDCQEPCSAVIDVTWKNNGDEPGTLIPKIIVNNLIYPSQYTATSLAVGASITKTFTLTGLTGGYYTVTTEPGGVTIPITVVGIGGCISSWACEYPLNGYENDGCGYRRLNSACNPITPPLSDGSSAAIMLVGVALGLMLLSKKTK
jgi:hypothetical protein